jgi:neutral ceramidase
MLAGVAVADITPPIGTPLQGHFSLHLESRGLLAPLEIRSVVFQNESTTVVIIAADLIAVPLDMTRRVRAAISQKHSIALSHILIAASHTHCGPATLPSIGLRPQADVLSQIERAMIGSVDQAMSALEPVTLGVGASAAHFNINRRPLPGQTEMFPNDAGVVDRRVRILRVDRADGSPLVVLFHYSCHPTAKNGSDGMISPDYPGFARARIEKMLGCRAAFLPGCFGNIRPNIVDAHGKFVSATAEQLMGMRDELGDAVVHAAKFTRSFADDRLAAEEREVFFPFGEMLPREEIEEMSKRLDQPLRADWAKRQSDELDRDPAAAPRRGAGEKSVMQAVRIGTVALVAIPGEPVQEIGYEIERGAANEWADVWPVGYANDQIGYLCTPRMYAEGGYEPTAYVVYDRPAPYRDEEAIIVTNAAELLRSISPRSTNLD